VPLDYQHDIPDLRAYEIAHGSWGVKAGLSGGVNGILSFNGQTYSMLPLPYVLEKLSELIQKQRLYEEIE